MGVPGTTLRTKLRAAVHAAGGAPRLFRAARQAGAGALESARVLAESAVVLFVVAPRAAGVPGRQNAVRHFVWQALLTSRHGAEITRAVADAQERGSVQLLDSATDRRNNAVGQAYGAAHATELSTQTAAAAMRELLQVGLAKWDAGELAARPGRGGRSAARRRRRGWPDRARPPSRP